MPRRGTMLLRNSRVLVLLFLPLLAAPAWRHQAAAQVANAASQPSAATEQPHGQPAQGPSPQSQDPQTQNQKTQGQSSHGQPSQPQQNPGEQTQDQGQASSDNGVFVFTKEVEEVVLHATATDDKNHLITTLDKSAFDVFENNQPQTITSFRHEDVPVSMGIVIDNSGSMREKRDRVNKAAINLVKSSNPQDEVFIVNFNDEYYLDQDFTADLNKMREALEKVETRGGTALYDAVVASADHLKRNGRLEKKVIFVVTDGEDNASRESLEQAIRRLQEENGPTVYTVGILDSGGRQRRAKRALTALAEQTGGVAFFPKDLSEVDSITQEVAHDIRNQYTIGYRPKRPQNLGGYRSVKVEAHARGYKKLSVRTRIGYYAGQERAATQ